MNGMQFTSEYKIHSTRSRIGRMRCFFTRDCATFIFNIHLQDTVFWLANLWIFTNFNMIFQIVVFVLDFDDFSEEGSVNGH
jgi:hypothetical protein